MSPRQLRNVALALATGWSFSKLSYAEDNYASALLCLADAEERFGWAELKFRKFYRIPETHYDTGDQHYARALSIFCTIHPGVW